MRSGEGGPRGEELPGLGHRREQDLFRQVGFLCLGDPHVVRTGDGAAMHSAQLAQINPTGWELWCGPEQWAPAACFHQAVPRYGATAVECAKVSDRLDAPEPDRLRLAAEAERSDQAGSGHSCERCRVGFEDVKGEATESVD